MGTSESGDGAQIDVFDAKREFKNRIKTKGRPRNLNLVTSMSIGKKLDKLFGPKNKHIVNEVLVSRAEVLAIIDTLGTPKDEMNSEVVAGVQVVKASQSAVDGDVEPPSWPGGLYAPEGWPGGSTTMSIAANHGRPVVSGRRYPEII